MANTPDLKTASGGDIPTIRISDLDPAGGANLTDEFHVNQGGNSRKLTVAQAIALVPGSPTAPPVIPASLPPSGPAGGDLSGTYPNPTIREGLISPPVVPTSLPPSGPAGGDLSGSYPNPTVRQGLIPTSLPPYGPAGGDLYGSYPNPLIRPELLLSEAPNDGKMYARRNKAWVEVVMPVVIPEAPLDGKTYARKNAAWVLSVGDPVVVSAGAVSGTLITTAATPFLLNPPSPNFGNFWNHAAQSFAPPPGVYLVNVTLTCVSTNNNANVALLMMINGTEYARATGGAAQANIMSATLALSVVTVAGDVLTFKMLSNRTDMTVRTPGSGLSIVGRANL